MEPPDPLSHMLKSWSVIPPSAPTFRTEVGQRIAALERSAGQTWGDYLQAHVALWLFVGAFSLLGAGWMGQAAGRVRAREAREKLVARYVASLDPLSHQREASP